MNKQFFIDDRGNCHEYQHTSFWTKFIFGMVVIAVGAVLLPRIARQIQ